ncbi:hypothetical protein NVV94_11590 [Pseudomonas sp. LS1212]|uniref:hypothetical protein n=1 Tax=Pseudomonas sp. LS1212 TaxID=2972478 RepID=UPI00215C2F02|nr:hypothetical protein [Pseudomonas sp. LS1212]UVJ46120.1 hypothetical protein NVV94_11590 [Pseudomonas sp. LS1212]
MNARKGLGWGVFLSAAAIFAWAPGHWFEDADEVEVVPATAATAKNVKAATQPLAGKAAVAQSKPSGVSPLQPQADLFAPHSWKPAPVLATVTAQALANAPVPLAAPTAPPLPFQFIGRIDDRNDVQVFLQKGEKLYVVRNGDMIDDTYRIVGISDTEMNMVYLPLHQSQTLSVGSAP